MTPGVAGAGSAAGARIEKCRRKGLLGDVGVLLREIRECLEKALLSESMLLRAGRWSVILVKK